ncbi:hypothetical protein OROGR_026556 [Orobanche gracilis]
MDEDLYGYFDPQSIQNMENKGEEMSGYITSRMSDAKKKYTLELTIMSNDHWQLLIIIPEKGVVVWFCSLHHKPDARIKAVIQNACNKQNGGWECGYYVMHWMSTIVRARIIDRWMEMFDDVATITIDRIHEIRTEWAKQFLEVRNRLYA